MKSKQSVILGLLLPTLPAAVEAQFEDHFMPIARTICRKVMATRYRAARAFGLLAILLSASPLTVEGWPNQYQFIYAIDNGAITIIGCSSADNGDVTIPSTLNGLPVTAIGESAFASASFLNSVTILDSITNIGEYAFWNYRQTRV